ncbi:MAG: DNA cytosine methyltransferase [Malacoplasma sp.]
MLKCASFFAGVGGIDLGFEKTHYFKTVYANEIDPFPIKTYEKNFDIKVDCKSIQDIKLDEIPDFDVMLAGFPCQSFSIAGKREGFSDEKGRGTLFFQLVRIFQEKKPSIIFLENVKNLVGHDNGNTFQTILNELKKENYYVKYSVLNAMEYGNIPQNRERIYIVAFKDFETYKSFDFPLPIRLTTKTSNIIDFNKKVDEKYYYTQGKYKGDLYEKLIEAIDDEKAIYQWRRKYVRKNKSNVIPTLTANQGEGGHNVCIVKTKYGIRKMIPHECFNAQGFPEKFKLPKELSDAKLYKQAGNSVCVSVVEKIAIKIKEAIENN